MNFFDDWMDDFFGGFFLFGKVTTGLKFANTVKTTSRALLHDSRYCMSMNRNDFMLCSASLYLPLSNSLALSLPVSLCLFRPDARDTTTTPSRLSICYFTPRKLYGNFHRHSWPRDDINSKSSRLICRARKLPLSRKAKRNFRIK